MGRPPSYVRLSLTYVRCWARLPMWAWEAFLWPWDHYLPSDCPRPPPPSAGPQLINPPGTPLSCPFSSFLGCSATSWLKATLHPEPRSCMEGREQASTWAPAACRYIHIMYALCVCACVCVCVCVYTCQHRCQPLSIEIEPPQGGHMETAVKLGFESASPFPPLQTPSQGEFKFCR